MMYDSFSLMNANTIKYGEDDLARMAPDIAIVGMPYTRQPKTEQKAVRRDFKTAKKTFLQALAESASDALRQAGFTPQQIEAMRQKGTRPQGWDIHHKLPVAGGGGNDFQNLILIRADVHEAIHCIINPQIQNMKVGERRIVNAPMPTGPLWAPPATSTQRGWIDDLAETAKPGTLGAMARISYDKRQGMTP